MLPVGATFGGSLESELSDSLALGYLRRIRYASRARGGKSLLLQKAEKDSHECDCLFLAERVVRKLNVASPTRDNLELR